MIRHARFVCRGLLFGAVVAASTTWAASPPPSDDVQMLRGATTYQIVVMQTGISPDVVELPFGDVLATLLDAAGLHPAAKDHAADVIVRVTATAEPLARDYDNLFRPNTTTHAFSGADVSGRCVVVRRGREREAFTFAAQWRPPDVIVKEYPKPGDAPFIEPFGDFVFHAADWVGRVVGVTPLLAVLGSDPQIRVNTDIPQLQIASADGAARYNRAQAIPALRARMEDGGALQRAAAARGLRLVQDHDSLPKLVAHLDEDENKLKQDDQTGWWTKITDLEEAVAEVDDENGEYDAGVEILAAVCALYRPTDRKLLLASLDDRGSVMRRIDAAIVFGRARDRGAVDALIAALKDDELLVRCAVANALGAIGDTRAIPALKSLAQPDDGTLDVTAAQAALDDLAPAKHRK